MNLLNSKLTAYDERWPPRPCLQIGKEVWRSCGLHTVCDSPDRTNSKSSTFFTLQKKKKFFFSDSQDLALRHSKLYSYFIRNYRNLHNSNWHYLSLMHCIIGPVIQGKRGFNELCLLLKRKWKRVEQINPWPNREYYAMQLMKARSAWGLSTWGRGHQRHTEDAVNCPFWTTRNPQEEFFL